MSFLYVCAECKLEGVVVCLRAGLLVLLAAGLRLDAVSGWLSLSRAYSSDSASECAFGCFVALGVRCCLTDVPRFILRLMCAFLRAPLAVCPPPLLLDALARRSLYKRTSAAAWNSCC